MPRNPSYFDCNATTPVDSRVAAIVQRFLVEEFGNAGSRSHEFGQRAKKATQDARAVIASLVAAEAEEVIFTSGATESNNIALLGLASHGEASGRRHIVSTQIEHKAVLEPLEFLQKKGFSVSWARVGSSGVVDPQEVRSLLRADTLLVSIMHVNNETGVIQPVEGIAEVLGDHRAFLHVDAAQGFGKELTQLSNRRIDMISISGHKVFAPKGVGALVVRRRGFNRIPLEPLMFGGGQERGLRPGTLSVPLIGGLGLATELARSENGQRRERCLALRSAVAGVFLGLGGEQNGDPDCVAAHVLNVSIPGVDSEALLVALKPHMAFSNGSACTSASYRPSHVLEAMGLAPERVRSAIRLSWSHATVEPSWIDVRATIEKLL